MIPRRVPLVVVLLAIAMTSAPRAQQLADAQSRREALAFFRTGQEFFSAEKFERAAEEFSKATAKDPLFTLAYYQGGQSYMNLKRYASAIQAFQRCLESTRSLYGLAESNRFDVEKQRDDEIHEMRQSIQAMRGLASKNPTGGYGLRAERAEQHLRDLENQRSSLAGGYRAPAEVLLSLGSAFFRNGDMAAATVQWEAAVAANSKLGEAHNNLAVAYMQAGRLADAEQELKLAEKNGFRVIPQFKDDLKARAKAERPQ